MEPGRGREGQVEPRLSPEDAAEARKILHAPEVSNEVKDTVREILVQDQERRLGQLRQEFTDNQGNPRTPLHAKLLQHAETELNSLKTQSRQATRLNRLSQTATSPWCCQQQHLHMGHLNNPINRLLNPKLLKQYRLETSQKI
ncbi:hypothetical protein NFJ02_36g91150 [Pycnococcus provasolii]